MILQALADQSVVGKKENASHRPVLCNRTYAPQNCIANHNNTNRVQITKDRETAKQEKKEKQRERKKEELKEKKEQWEADIKRAVEAIKSPKTMADNVENMEVEDKQLIRAIRGPAIQRGTAITFIDASTSIAGDKFNLSLFCDTGAAIDVCSMDTVIKRGAKIEYK